MSTTIETVLCCLCGTSIAPNPSNMCLSCIRSQIDITSDYSKSEIISFCRTCERYLQPPKYWIDCDLESKELLTLCLKKIRGLNKAKLIDASFIWTEPHSRRVKVKITIQKEVFNGTKLQQSFVVEYVVKNQQCEGFYIFKTNFIE
jgi:nonsense-mediated mRNA decay protein 3